MNPIEKVCLESCHQLFSSFSVPDKNVLNNFVTLTPGNDKIAEVVFVTKDDEYTFVLDLTEDSLINDSKSKYNLKTIKIKGFDIVEWGTINYEYLRIVLEELAKVHARCIAENNFAKKNYQAGVLVVDNKKETFLDILQKIIVQVGGENFDQNVFIEGIKTIEDSFQTLKSDEDFVIVNGTIPQTKIFIKNTETSVEVCRILNFSTEEKFPIVYDLLLTIFNFTDQNMRQHFFHDLLYHYYQSLEKNLQKLSLDITKCLSKTAFQRQINKYLPCVKLEILKQLCEVSTNKQCNKIRTAILEVNECILYSNLSREDCYKIIKNKIGSSDYIFLNYKLIALQEREGYLGEYFKLKIEIQRKGILKMFHLFAKYVPTYSEFAVDLAVPSFKKEEFYYLEFIPKLNNFGLGDITNFLPECYFSRTNEVLIFQDVVLENYRTFSVTVSYTYEMLLVTMKQLAKVHASSLLYEELSSEKHKKIVRLDEKYPKYTEEINVRNTEETLMKSYYDCAIRTFLEMLSVFPEIPKKLSMKQFKERTKLAFDLCFEKVKKSDKFRNVLNQGDCWASNIFFKTDENNSFIDCLLVDYQLTRYCPPGHDIYFFLYMATNKETRAKYESKLLQEYYSELSNIFQRHMVDLEKIYTYQGFLDSCKYMKSQGLCHATMVLQFVLFPVEKIKNILKDKEQERKVFYENRDIFIEELRYGGTYGQRIKELVEEMYDICENNLF